MSAAPQLSVVMPTFRRRASVARALHALAEQTLAPDLFEVVVAIDGSQDGSRELVAGFTAPYTLRHVWQPNRGRAAAVNAGVRLARGEVLVILDDDMEPAPGCLAGHWRAQQSGPRNGTIGAAPIRVNAASPAVVAEYVAPKFNQHLERLASHGHRLVLRDFYSGNFSIRRSVLLSVGLFDEAFRLYGNEDLELSLRLTRAGVTLQFSTEALANQHYQKDFAALARDTHAKGQTAVQLASKHPEAFAHLQLSQFRQYAPAWQALRAGLLAIGPRGPTLPRSWLAALRWMERLQPARLRRRFYRLSLDYCYWLGVTAAIEANRRHGQGLQTLGEPTWA